MTQKASPMIRRRATAIALGLLLVTTVATAAKRDETEGTGQMPGGAKAIYDKTDKKAAERPGQTVLVKPVAAAKGPAVTDRATKGEETAGTAPAREAAASPKK